MVASRAKVLVGATNQGLIHQHGQVDATAYVNAPRMKAGQDQMREELKLSNASQERMEKT